MTVPPTSPASPTTPPSPTTHVLLPGRHHVVTRFQADYLRSLLAGGERDTAGVPVACAPGARVVWAVTSASHHGTRRNPVPAHRREAMIERVAAAEGVEPLVVPVADVPPSPRFAHTVLASVELSLGVALTPGTTVVACSTPEVAALYADLGFRVAPVEEGHPDAPARPWDVLRLAVDDDPRWRELAHPAALAFWERYGLLELVRTAHLDPTVSAEGDLTQTRDYRSYTAAFDDASDRKWGQVGPHVRPGRVVDLGCAAGGLLERAARDPRLAESDLYGVDVSRHLVAEAEHRKAQGVFANPNVFFAQRNLLTAPVFPDATVSTTTTIALTHEISSYGAGRADLELLARRIFAHTAPGGVWINSDVLGPADGDRLVHLHLDARTGDAGDVTGTGAAVDLEGLPREEVETYVAGLSPAARLVQFAHDFPRLSGGACDVRWLDDATDATGPAGTPTTRTAELTLRAAMEFLTTRDYVGNWLSECHERFCDMTWADWVALLEGVGFELEPASAPWRNDWLVENRLAVGACLTDPAGGDVAWPDTHVLTVARRPG